MGVAEGFQYTRNKAGDVVITHHGRVATVLRGSRAIDFLVDIGDTDPDGAQALMARLTGNYRRGNERQASQHPRSRR